MEEKKERCLIVFNDTDKMDEIIDDLLDKLLFYYRCRAYRAGFSASSVLEVVEAVEQLRRKVNVARWQSVSGCHPQRCDRTSQPRKIT